MASKTMTSLAIIKVNSDKGMDYIGSFVPFLTHIIRHRQMKEVNVQELIREFEDLYGLIVPSFAMKTIINRATKKGYLKKQDRGYFPVSEKIAADDFTDISVMQVTKYQKITRSFIDFAKTGFNRDLSFQEAEAALLDFIKEHDVEILLASQSGSLIPEVKSKVINKFILGKFIADALKTDPTLFEYLVDISLGQALANAIIYEESAHYICNLSGMNCFLDTGIIFNLLGTSGPARKREYQEFLGTLITSKVKLFIFDHTYDEVMTILHNCLSWIDNPTFDAMKAGKAMLYFVTNGFTKSDIDLFIAEVQPALEKCKIGRVDIPSFMENINYQIDEEGLKDIIFDIYKSNDPDFEYYEKQDTINKDIDSISAIYRHRKGRIFRNLKDTSHLFVTSNWALASATKEYEITKIDKHSIPAAVTDVFLGTILWVSNPKKYREVNRIRLLADVYASIQPNNRLLRLYLNEIRSIEERKGISPEEIYLLRSTRVAINLLQEKTCNDPENFKGTTPSEILEEVKEKIRQEIGEEANAKYLIEKESRENVQEKLRELDISNSTVRREFSGLESGVKWLTKEISGTFSFIITVMIAPAIFVGALWSILSELIKANISKNTYILFMIMAALYTILDLILGITLRKLRNSIRAHIDKWLFAKMEKHKTPTINEKQNANSISSPEGK